MQYKILSFNVLRMRSPVAGSAQSDGHPAEGCDEDVSSIIQSEGAMEQKYKKDWNAIAHMIRQSGAVIVALQEILDDYCVERLQRQLGGQWNFIVSDQVTIRNGGRDGYRYYEKYAFLWDERYVKVLHLDDPKKSGPHIETRFSSIKRPPYVARFVPNTPGALPLMEIRVINTHIAFSVDRTTQKRVPDMKDIPMRLKEYVTIANKVFPKVAKERDGYCAYTFVAGDYNLSCKHLMRLDGEIVPLQEDPTTLRRKFDSAESRRNPYLHNYDHFSASRHEMPYVQYAMRIDGICETGKTPETYLKEVSDHVPIKLGFDVAASHWI